MRAIPYSLSPSLPKAAKATGSFATGHAIVIGVANYRHGSPLPSAVLNDAQDVAAVLKANEYCGYDERNVHLLLDGDATLERIRAAFVRGEIRGLQDFTVFPPISERKDPYKKALYEEVMAPLEPEDRKSRRRGQSDRPANSFNGNQAVLISMAMKLEGKLPHELTRDDIMRASHYEGDTISNSISEVFTAYKVDQFIWAHRRIETESIEFAELIAEYRTKYPPPWDTLREILSAMRDAARLPANMENDYEAPRRRERTLRNAA